jgi:hypothetical protein
MLMSQQCAGARHIIGHNQVRRDNRAQPEEHVQIASEPDPYPAGIQRNRRARTSAAYADFFERIWFQPFEHIEFDLKHNNTDLATMKRKSIAILFTTRQSVW